MRHRVCWSSLGVLITVAACRGATLQTPDDAGGGADQVAPSTDAQSAGPMDGGMDADLAPGADADTDAAANDTDAATGDDAALPPLDVPPTMRGDGPVECVADDTVVRHSVGDSRFVSVVWTGAEYGLAWQDEMDGPFNIRFARVSAAGEVLVEDAVTTNSSDDRVVNEYPSLTWDGSAYQVAWARTDVATNRAGIYLVAVAPAGTAGIHVGAPVHVNSTDAADTTLPSLQALPADAGGGLAVFWEDGRGGANRHAVYYRRMNSAAPAGAEVRVSPSTSGAMRPVSAFNRAANELAVLFQDTRDDPGASPNEELYLARILPDGTRPANAADVRVTNDPERSLWQSIAWSGAGYGVAWVNESGLGDTPAAYFTLLDPQGHVVRDAAPRKLSTGAVTNREYSSAVAWNGAEFMVVWQDNRHQDGDLMVRRVDATGSPLGVEYFLANDRMTSDHASLVWGHDEWFLAWEDNRDGNRDVWFRRMPRGACLDAGATALMSAWPHPAHDWGTAAPARCAARAVPASMWMSLP